MAHDPPIDCAGLRSDLDAFGCTSRALAYDALIAATAVANSLPVLTRNPDDFAGFESLTVVTLDSGA